MVTSRDKLAALVRRYEEQRQDYVSAGTRYGEADTRGDFLDPLFEALGWDLQNERGLPQRLREIVRETRVAVDENTKRPDYVFRLGPERRFFAEAKRPIIDLVTDNRTAFQVRRYGWSAGLMISVATNFESLVIYDTTTKPSPDHTAGHSRLFIFSYREYIDQFDRIASLISRDAVYSGHFDEFFSRAVENRASEAIDAVFLRTLKDWRLQLGRDILAKRPDISKDYLNEIVQRFILRILFLRMCEDRGIQTYEQLKSIADKNDWHSFIALLHTSNAKFDSELFDTMHDPFFSTDGASLSLDTTTVQGILSALYFPQAPYTFSVLQPEFLGDIYEYFLSESLTVLGDEIVAEPKPETVGRDVISTPRSIIQRIVRETLGPLLANASPAELLRLRIVDPACGSGGFLISAFDHLIDRTITAYREIGDFKTTYDTDTGTHLVFDQKRQLLRNCLYGVDKDPLAVEVTRFSLLVKLLEDDSIDSLVGSREPILPRLERNIVTGDSLIDDRIYADFSDPRTVSLPLTWGHDIQAFYNVVIGNPPYLNTEAMVNLEPTEYDFYRTHYESAYKQFDKYYLFIERSLKDLLANEGLLGMIVSNKFTHIQSGRKLRRLISRGRHLVRMVDFGTAQLFKGRTTYTCLLFLSKSEAPRPDEDEDDSFEYELVTTPQDWLADIVDQQRGKINLPRYLVSGDSPWLLPSTPSELELIKALSKATVPLGDIMEVFNGIQTSKNSVYVITEWHNVDEHMISFVSGDREWPIESDILKLFFHNGQLRSFHQLPDTARIIFPYIMKSTFGNGPLRAEVISPDTMADKFPKAYAWLKHNEIPLRSRNIEPAPYPEGEWYRYGRDQALTSFEDRPKIVVGVNSLGDKYVYDTSNTLLASGGTAGECAIAPFKEPARRTQYDLYFILAILNHKAIEYYCRKRGSPFRGGWFARGTAVLKDVPVPVISFDSTGKNARTLLYNEVVRDCKELCSICQLVEGDISGSKRTEYQRRVAFLKRRMNSNIAELYGITGIINQIELPT